MPAHLAMQTTSVTLGGSGGVIPPPAAKAQPAHTDSDAPTTAAGIAVRHPRRAGAIPWGWGLKRSLSLSPACGVSCRARAERAALRTNVSDSPQDGFDTAPLVPPPRCGWAASDSAGHLSGGSITRWGAEYDQGMRDLLASANTSREVRSTIMRRPRPLA